MRAMKPAFLTIATCLAAALLVLAGCSRQPPITQAETAKYTAVFTNAQMTARAQQKWARSCALCHVAGQGGAPRMGHPNEWKPRLEQGTALLLKHTLEGYNRMPPLGYCMSCDTSDLAAMINMMSGLGQ